MATIGKIYTAKYIGSSREISYIGTLRNEKKFNIDDKVFFAYDGHKIFCSTIVGVEKTIGDNPDYFYKIQLPEELIRERLNKITNYSQGVDLDTITLKCDKIFNSIQEAKESALAYLEHMANVQRKEIDYYFDNILK